MIAALVAMAGGGVLSGLLPRYLRTEILRVLRPAESAFRRLVVVYRAVNAVDAPVLRARVAAVAVKRARGAGVRKPSFALLDRRIRIDFNGVKTTTGNPRIRFFDWDEPADAARPAPLPDDPVSAARLNRRLQALQRALDTLPEQAKRLARWEARRKEAPPEARKYRPMRPGRPPGHRKRGRHPVDDVLKDCHGLALYTLAHPPEP